MSQRPEILWPLFADPTVLDGIGPKSAQNLARMEIQKPVDLLLTLPTSGTDRRLVNSIRDAVLPGVVTVEIEVGMHQKPAAKNRPYRIFVRDAATEFQLVFFHPRGDWLQRTFPSGQRRLISGRIELFDGLAQMPHPDHVLRPGEEDTLPKFEPVYPLTQGITQRTMSKATASALELAPELAEWIEPSLKAQRGWPDWHAALRLAHSPQNASDLAQDHPARERLAYDELLSHQITLALARNRVRYVRGVASVGTGTLQNSVLNTLPYKPTNAQSRAVAEITADMASPLRMNRLLQGDVGSGKTIVALMAILAAVEAGGQAAMMAPTEILARQHLESLAPLVETLGVRLDLLTGRDKGKSRDMKLASLAEGTTKIVIGTHSLFQADVEFQDLRIAVIDEQHRFGVRQRMDLGSKGRAPDILVMTATPIPRSLSLAQYGDMDISVLDEKPPGRKPVDTVIISSDRTGEVIARLRGAIEDGQQAYWVCPLVHDSETAETTAAEDRYQSLCTALGADGVGLVHGQLPPAQKDAVMRDFVNGNIRLLVATTVIEVGVNVPNASIMVIEAAQSFGLAQLHQLRGRVGRGADKSSCLLLYDSPLGEAANARLKIMRETEDGFDIAEEDLRLRGAGDLLGVQQSGLPKFRIADLEQQSGLMRIAQDDSRLLLSTDTALTSKRGRAARILLHLMEREKAIQMLSAG